METPKNSHIEEILSSLDNAKRAEVPSFFYTRLKARMEKETTARPSWILRPAFALAALLLIILVNAFVIFQSNQTKDTDSVNTVASTLLETESMQSLASEFSLNTDNSTLLELNQDSK